MPTQSELQREDPFTLSEENFKKIAYQLVDNLAKFYATIPERKVTEGASPSEIWASLGNDRLPDNGKEVEELITRVTQLLTDHSLLNGHPKFFGYITSSPTQIGALADLLAAAINPNVGANILSPMATAIEKQTIQWLAEFIGVPSSWAGVIVSGGNMANLTAFLAARTAKAPKSLKESGLQSLEKEMVFYCSKATHTWIEKAAVLFGHGLKAMRWIPALEDNSMDITVLKETIKTDLASGKQPFLVIANAGDVSTGVVDDLKSIAGLCKEFDLWFHIDGAYGVPAAILPECTNLFEGMQEADSIAIDPHKWLYAPLEAGCTLVKNPQHLIDTYSAHPVYYNFDNTATEPTLNFYEYGFQNSRGFKALKVWLALQQAGKNGYINSIREDIRLAELLFHEAKKHPELEEKSQNLSITTFRYKPLDTSFHSQEYLNKLNEKMLNEIQKEGKAFLSNAVLKDHYYLRACIVNYRTSETDIHETVEIIIASGRKMHSELQQEF